MSTKNNPERTNKKRAPRLQVLCWNPQEKIFARREVDLTARGTVLNLVLKRKFILQKGGNDDGSGSLGSIQGNVFIAGTDEQAFWRCAFSLPATVQQEGVKAKFNNGILEITLPKAEAAKPKQIKVD